MNSAIFSARSSAPIKIPSSKIEQLRNAFNEYSKSHEPLRKYPGVTRVISGTSDKSWVDEWRKNIGEEKADQILAESQRIGTCLDKMICDRLESLNFDQTVYQPDDLNTAIRLFRQLTPILSRLQPVLVQPKLWSNNLETMGYADCLGFLDGVLTLVDFKNSKKPRDDMKLQDYQLQATFYAMMIYDMIGVFPEQIALFIAVRSDPLPQVVIKPSNLLIKEVLKRKRIYYENL